MAACSSTDNTRTIAYNSKSQNAPGYRTAKKKKAKKSPRSSKMSQRSNKKQKRRTQQSKVAHRSNRTNKTYTRTHGNSTYPESTYTNCNANLSYLLEEKNCSKESLYVRVDKSDYKLSVFTYGELIKEYPVVFGKNPTGDKLMQGDKRTPEGNFKVRAYYPHDKWEKFVWIDYPTSESYQKHRKAKERGLIPESASIGGSIGIHGVPDNKNYAITERQNWTLGCIAMKNQDINELYPFVSKGMAIEIFD